MVLFLRVLATHHKNITYYEVSALSTPSSDDSLFTATRYNTQHVLHQLLPRPKHTVHNLLSRGHGLTLFVTPSEYTRKKFVNRML